MNGQESASSRLFCFLALLCALCVSAVSFPSGSQEPTNPESRSPVPAVLIYGAGLAPRGLNPLLDRNGWNEVSSVLLSRLFRADHEGRIVGDLVESYTVSADGLSWTLKLRENVRWHDGEPFTSADVLFSWEKLFDPATATSLDLNQPMLRDFAATGPYEFVFRLRYPDAGFLAPLTEVPILPAHLLAEADINSNAFEQNPVGTGPYMLAKQEGSDYVFDRHAYYHFGAPAIPRLVLRIIADDDVRAEALASGLLHLAQVKPQHVPRLRALKHLRVYRFRTGAWRGMPLNLRRAALKDVRVRRAIDLAIDREAIVAAALAGFGQPAYSPIPPASWAFDPAMNQPRHDPARAERLLEEAGWRRNAAGLRVREGEVLELNVIVWKEETFRRTAAVLIRAQLEALGLRVNLHLVDGATYNRLADDMGTTYDGFIGGWGGLLDPGDNLGKKFHSRGSQNYMGYSNTEVDRLLARARALPPQRRGEARRLYRELVERVTADAVFLPLAYPDYVFAADARLSLGPYSQPAMPEESGKAQLAGPPVMDSWYEFPKFAHYWSWSTPGTNSPTPKLRGAHPWSRQEREP